MNRGWKLVVHVNARSKRVSYQREAGGVTESDEEGENILPQHDSTDALQRGDTLISVEADDLAGEDDVNSIDGDERIIGSDNLDLDEEEEEEQRPWHYGLDLPDLEASEIHELESDGEFEEESP